MLEGAGFQDHINHIEKIIRDIKGEGDRKEGERVSSLFPKTSSGVPAKDLSAKVTRLNDDLAKEVKFIQGLLDADNFESVDLDKFAHMVPVLQDVLTSLTAQDLLIRHDPTYKELMTNITQVRDMLQALPMLMKKPVPQKTRGRMQRRVRTRRRKPETGKKLVQEDVADVTNYVNRHKDTLFADAKKGALYHRQYADTEFRQSFQVLNIETATSPDELVIVVHPKPEEKVVTRKGKETNVMHIGIGGEKTVKKSVLVDLKSGKRSYVAVATSRKDIRYGKRLVEKELSILSILSGKPGIIELKGHCVYQVKKKEGVEEPLPTKMNMVLAFGDNDLRGELAKRRISKATRQGYTLEMLTGLVEIHKAGIIHYDLKLDNIFIVDGHPKIGDFGNADRFGVRVTRRGTTEIIPPEMHRLIGVSMYKDILHEEQDRVGPRMDVFEMGVILYQMKHDGSPQFVRDIRKSTFRIKQDDNLVDDFETYAQTIEQWYTSEKPKDKEDKIIFNMLNPDPDLRPSSQEALEQFARLYM